MRDCIRALTCVVINAKNPRMKTSSRARLNKDSHGGRSGDSHGDYFWVAGLICFRILLASALVAISYLAFGPAVELVPGGDKSNHLLAFFVLGLLLDWSFPTSNFSFAKMAALFMYGCVIEGVQYGLVDRDMSVADLIANTGGILLYAVLIHFTISVPSVKQVRANMGLAGGRK